MVSNSGSVEYNGVFGNVCYMYSLLHTPLHPYPSNHTHSALWFCSARVYAILPGTIHIYK